MAAFDQPFVLATGNADKVNEILEIVTDAIDAPLAALALEPVGFLVARFDAIGDAAAQLGPLPSDVDVEETGTTLTENARIKAAALQRATRLTAIADDTGLFVDALDGAPGVYSARYAGPDATYADNVAELLHEMIAVDEVRRGARFETVALAVLADGREIAAHGVVEGRIAVEAHGDAGFGYDPVFVPEDGDGRTFAEMSPAEKHGLSHRGRAFRALAARLAEEG